MNNQNKILVINSGSSSIKFAVIDINSKSNLALGIAEKLYSSDAILKLNDKCIELTTNTHEHAIKLILKELNLNLQELLGVGHRVVHGGHKFNESILVNSTILTELKELNILAPLHNPANIKGIEIIQALEPKVANVAVFDTAFHQTMPEKAYTYALPHSWLAEHNVRRYGFHGTSHKYVVNQVKGYSKVISLHLGNGCSAAAVLDGKCIDTSMGFTPLEGLIMGTRAGDIDAGILEYMQHKLQLSFAELNAILNKKSGLLGISGLSNDMRTLEAEYNTNAKAKLAIEMFCYSIAKYVGSYMVVLGGLDLIIFTGGIGENSKLIREKLLSYLNHIKFESKVIPTNEELMIAIEAHSLLC